MGQIFNALLFLYTFTLSICIQIYLNIFYNAIVALFNFALGGFN